MSNRTRITLRFVGVVLFGVAATSLYADAPDGLYGRQKLAAAEGTSEMLVFLQPGTDAKQFAKDHGLVVKHALRSDPNAYVLTATSAQAARMACQDVAATDSRVRASYVNQRTRYVRMAFVPNDPYFHKDTPAPGWPGEWHLLNEYTSGLDARVEGAWNRDVTGTGVIIGLVDDSLETAHADLAANYVAADSWDFGQNDGTPDPVYSDDQHGTATAGVAAARGGNGIGVTGVAPYAGLAGLRIDFYNQTTQMLVDATLFHSSGSNTNIKVKNHSYGISYPYIPSAAVVAALGTSAAAGTIHCVAAGNERGYSGQDANKKDLQHSPDCICVAAMGSNGKFASYSCFGACVFVTAPSSSSSGLFHVTTTDRTGEALGYNGASDSFPDADFTSLFGGTSSASPVVAGVMALVKQVQPVLNVRFAKHLLARTSDVIDAADPTYWSDGGWRTNAAGFHFDQNYGFGLINADQLTQKALLYTGVTPLSTESTGTITVDTPIPDNSFDGVVKTFSMTSTTPLEEVLVHLNVTHGIHGQIEARLTSPSGLVSRLISSYPQDHDPDIDWTFCTNAFWGENPAGTWTLRVQDIVSGEVGTWNSYGVTVRMGTLESARGPEITQQPAEQRVAVGATATLSVQATGAQPLSYQWMKGQNNLSDGGKISGATSDTLQITNCDVADLGGYRCVVTNAFGNATSNSATLTVTLVFIVESRSGGLNFSGYSEYTAGLLENSTAKSTASGTTAGIGSRWGSLDRNASGIKRAIYSHTAPAAGLYEVFVTWPASTNAGNVEHLITHVGGTASIMADQNSARNPAGGNAWNSIGQYNLIAGTAYTVTQTNENFPAVGYIFRADAVKWELVSAAGGPTITQQPLPQDVCPGSTATFTVTATGQGTTTYQWQRNGGNLADSGRISGVTTDTLQITEVDSADLAEYRCILTDANGNTRSTSAPLTLAPTTITRHPSDRTVPPSGGVVSFTVEAVGKGTLTYQWQKNQADLADGGKISGATTSTLLVSGCDSGDQGAYRCVVTGGCDSATSNAASLTVSSGLISVLVESRTGGQNRDSYSEFGVFSDSTAKSVAAGVTPGIGSRWGSMDRVASGIKRAIYSCTAPATGVYELFATWPNSANASTNVEHIVTHAGGSASVLKDQVVSSSATGANRWNSLGRYDLTAGTAYTVTQTNENYPDPGRIFRADAVRWDLVSTAGGPVITEHPLAQNVCPRSMAVFTVVATGDPAPVFQWQKNLANLTDGGHYSGATTATLSVSDADSTDVANYRCLVTNAGGTAVSTQAFLTLKSVVSSDLDADCDVDLDDFTLFRGCFNGPNRLPAAGCAAAASLDGDSDVDLDDFTVFRGCFNGPNRAPVCP